MDLTYSVSKSDVEAFCAHCSLTTQKRLYRLFWVWISVLLAILAGVSLLRGSNWPAAIWASLTIIWLFFGRRCFTWLSLKTMRSCLSRSDLGTQIGEQHLSTEELGLRCTTTGSDGVLKWSAIKRIEETNRHVFIYVSDLSAFVISRESVTADALDAFLADVRQRMVAA
jgi:hypothetical protein